MKASLTIIGDMIEGFGFEIICWQKDLITYYEEKFPQVIDENESVDTLLNKPLFILPWYLHVRNVIL